MANIFDVFDLKLNSTQEKQLEIASKITKNFKLHDLKLETVQQKQIELTSLSERNGQKINILWTNLTDNMQNLNQKLNSTQEEQLELASRLRDHGHGNKGRINQLASQLDGQTRKIGLLWINFLDSKNLLQPILEKYPANYAQSIGLRDLETNKTEAIYKEINELETEKLETDEFKRLVTDRMSGTLVVKLSPTHGNSKKVKTLFQRSHFSSIFSRSKHHLGNVKGQA